MRLTSLFKAFFESEKTGGILLIICTIISLLLANSDIGEAYTHFWHTNIGSYPVEFWINDALMTVFFFLIGLEVERELYVGELANKSNAILPLVAAIGGIAVPALIHFALNNGTPYQRGLGIPMATDIAFSLGILSLLGNRVPASLKVFLTALAIIDDIGAILIIAIFYSNDFSFLNFGLAMGIFAFLIVLNRLRVMAIWPYILLGMVMWYFMHESGIHATITGVLVAFALPFGDGSKQSPSYRTQHFLHVPVAYIILPLFALANTGIIIPTNWTEQLTQSNSLGIMAGLVVGKPLGVVLFSLAAVAMGITALPSGLRRIYLVGAGLLAGIGFTMAIFITLLAFKESYVIIESKIAILIASLVAGILGYLLLWFTLPKASEMPKQLAEEI